MTRPAAASRVATDAVALNPIEQQRTGVSSQFHIAVESTWTDGGVNKTA
jgi:hypothetical protein